MVYKQLLNFITVEPHFNIVDKNISLPYFSLLLLQSMYETNYPFPFAQTEIYGRSSDISRLNSPHPADWTTTRAELANN